MAMIFMHLRFNAQESNQHEEPAYCPLPERVTVNFVLVPNVKVSFDDIEISNIFVVFGYNNKCRTLKRQRKTLFFKARHFSQN